MYTDQIIERTQEKQAPRPYVGLINNTVAAYNDDVYVTIPSIDDGEHKWGPCRWSLRGADYPHQGDIALITFDETGVPWITEWVPTLPTPIGGSVADASVSVKGVNKMSVAPAVAANPIAVGDNDPRNTNARTPTAHTHPESDVTNLTTDLAARELIANKGAASGYAPLDSGLLVPVANLPAATGAAKGAVQLAGDLAGTAAAPAVGAGAITDAKVNAAAAIAESKLALATDAAVGTGSRRTLGAGALQAMPGNRTLDAVPLAAADVNVNTHKLTNVVNPTVAQDAATKAYVDAAAVNKGRFAQAAAGTRANAAYGALSNGPDKVAGLVVAVNQVIRMYYHAIWAQTAGDCRAAIFIVTNPGAVATQLVVGAGSGPPVAQFAGMTGAVNDSYLHTNYFGLVTGANIGGVVSDVTTGQVIAHTATGGGGGPGNVAIGGGATAIFGLPAGTYDVEVRFLSAGTVTVKNRLLVCEVI